VGEQLRLAGIDDAQLKEAVAAAQVPAALSTWLYGIHYDETTFEEELRAAAEHMSALAAGSRG